MTTSASPSTPTQAAAAQTPGRRHKRDAPANAFDAMFAAISANVPVPVSPPVPATARAVESHGSTKRGAVAIAGDPVATIPEPSTDAVASSMIRVSASSPQPARDAPNAADDEMDVRGVPIRPHEAESAAGGDAPAIVPRDSAAALPVHADALALPTGDRVFESQSAAGASIPRERSLASAMVLREFAPSTLSPAPPGKDTASHATTPVTPILASPSASPKSVVGGHERAVAIASSVESRDTTDVKTRSGVQPAITSSQPHDSHASAAAREPDADARRDAGASAQWVESASGKPASSARTELGRQRQFSLQAQASGAAPQGIDVEFASFVASPADAIATLVALGKAAAAVSGDSTKRSTEVDAEMDVNAGIGIGGVPWTGIGGSVSAPTAGMAASPSAAFDEATWREAMTRQVTAAAVAQARETSVRLDAKGLGPIEVHVRVAAERVDVHFLIQRPVTADIVRDALPDLQRLLGQSGMTLGDASVAHQHAGGRGGDGALFRTTGARGDDDDTTGIASVQAPRVRVGLLDHFA
jgi:hypothetical protein